MGLPTMQFHNVLSFSFNYEKPTRNITVNVCVCVCIYHLPKICHIQLVKQVFEQNKNSHICTLVDN